MKAALISNEAQYSVKIGTDKELYDWLRSELASDYHRLFWLDGAEKLQVDYNHRLDWYLAVDEVDALFNREVFLDEPEDLARMATWERVKKEVGL